MIFDNDGANAASITSQQQYGSTTGIIVDSNLTPSFSDESLNEEQLSEYKLHDELDSRLWTSDKKLRPEVKEALLHIADLFEESLEDILTLVDIRVTGSEANYNYNDASDIDLHVIYDFSEIQIDPTLLSDYFKSKKQIFNDQYSFEVNGVPVEVSVEDNSTSSLVATGIYSLLTDTWLRVPENAGLEVTSFNVENYDKILGYIRNILQTQDLDQLRKLWKNIKGLRKLSLAIQGEFGEGNLIFKKLRADGVLKQVKDALNAAVSRELSLYNIDNDYYRPNIPVVNNEFLTDIEQDNNTSIFGGLA